MVYYNYKRKENELTEEVIFCSNNSVDSRHYGNLKRTFMVDERCHSDREAILLLAIEFLAEETGEDISEDLAYQNLNPDSIKECAGLWACKEFVRFAYDRGWFESSNYYVTPNGALVFDHTLMSAPVALADDEGWD